ncbi:MAG: hypothetical protein ACE5JG_03485 [Planctomycetota bacterium]
MKKKYWLDDPRNVTKVVSTLLAVCLLLVASDLFHQKEGLHFPPERWPGFYGFYGFLCCVFLVLTAKQLRRILMRGEDYYDR